MRKFLSFIVISSLFLGLVPITYSQEQTTFPPDLTLKFGGNGESYLTTKILFQGQIRNRDGINDLSLRRCNILLFGDITPYFTYFAHISTSAFSTSQPNGIPSLRIGDLTAEANISEYFKIGFGLHAWNGISRISSGTVISQLILDPTGVHNPIGAFGNNVAMRQIGLFARGHVQNFNYQIAVNQPFRVDDPTQADFLVQAQYLKTTSLSYQGYFSYSFFDKERQKISFSAINYLGTKKVFNVGLGYYYQPNSMGSLKDGKVEIQDGKIQTEISDQNFFGVDVYYDVPILTNDKGTGAIILYSVAYLYQYGKNYIHIGPYNNPITGNGVIWHSQAGFLIPPFFDPKFGQLQPFLSHSTKWLESLENATNQFDWGLNWVIKKHNAKITFQHSILPKVDINAGKSTDITQHFTLQLQLYI